MQGYVYVNIANLADIYIYTVTDHFKSVDMQTKEDRKRHIYENLYRKKARQVTLCNIRQRLQNKYLQELKTLG